MRKIILLVLILFIHEKNFAESFKSSIFLFSESIYIPKNYKLGNPYDQIGIGYQMKVMKKYSINVSYREWISTKSVISRPTVISENKKLVINKNGFVPFYFSDRVNYHFIDFCIGKYARIKQNEISVYLGLNYAWGENVYTEYYLNGYWQNGTFIIWDAISNEKFMKARYWGITAQLFYNYYFKCNRVNIGIHLNSRYLFEYTKPQIELGLHIGYNFNLFRKRSK
ncbi:MAG: hypothetical protein RL708_1912 [Bacteroidota bacterium]|jgi:hypothetical protein